VQNAKDTFYETLKARIAAANPERTVVLRGVTRVGVFVAENELAEMASPLDCFALAWQTLAADTQGPATIVAMRCTIQYATAGSGFNAGMDRGRLLATMDTELLNALSAAPQCVVKQNYAALANGSAAVSMGSNIWWSDVSFDAVTVSAGELRRTAQVTVWSYQEAGEV
jgi:hypothetical protein